MPPEAPYRVPLDRSLAKAEVDLIEWLLRNARQTDAAILTEWSAYRVISGCDCGCGTLDLSVPGRVTDEDTHRIIADAWGASPEGAPVNVVLHGESGIVTELEIVPLAGQVPTSLPQPSALRPWPSAG